MTSNRDRDDDALSWAGDDDPTLQPDERPAAAAASNPLAAGDASSAHDAATAREPRAGAAAGAEPPLGGTPPAETGEPAADETPEQTSSVALIGYGVLGGVFLLYAVGWFVVSGRIVDTASLDPVSAALAVLGRWLAVAAPALWFASVVWFGRRHSAAWAIVRLAVGAVLLVPWPLLGGI